MSWTRMGSSGKYLYHYTQDVLLNAFVDLTCVSVFLINTMAGVALLFTDPLKATVV